MNEKYLPIGTVVLLKNAEKRLMITGFVMTDQVTKKEYDYSGVMYPEGIISTNETALFNHEQIEKIYAIGYSDEEEKMFKEKLKELLNKNNLEMPNLKETETE